MQYTTLTGALLALLSATALAAPATTANEARQQPALATIALSNDMTGTYASAQLTLNPSSAPQTLRISDVWNATPLNKNGVFVATSASLVGGLARPVQCTIESSPGNTIARLTSRRTYAKLGSDPNTLQQIDLTNALITCIECQSCQSY